MDIQEMPTILFRPGFCKEKGGGRLGTLFFMKETHMHDLKNKRKRNNKTEIYLYIL